MVTSDTPEGRDTTCSRLCPAFSELVSPRHLGTPPGEAERHQVWESVYQQLGKMKSVLSTGTVEGREGKQRLSRTVVISCTQNSDSIAIVSTWKKNPKIHLELQLVKNKNRLVEARVREWDRPAL